MPPDLSGLDVVAGNSQLAANVLGGSAMGALGGATGQANGQGANGQGANGQRTGGQTGNQTGGQTGGSGGAALPGGGGGNTGGNNTGTNPGGTVTNTMAAGGNNPAVQSQTQQATSTYADDSGTKIIGLYGSSTELQIDISRLPRVDQYQTQFSADGINQVVDIPSDMKTVSYYLGSEDGTVIPSGGGLSGIDVRGRGLYRHTLDRAVSTYAMESGSANKSLGKTDLLADEVIGLQFMYFDGAGWAEEWDSSSMEGLPVAIEITLILGNPEQAKTATGSFNPFGSTSEDEDNERYYTLTVNLPTALTADEKAQASESEDTALSQAGSLDTSGDAAASGMLGGVGGMGGMAGGLGGLGSGQGGPGGGRGQGQGGQGGPGGGGRGQGGQGGPGGGGRGQGGFGGGQGGFGGGQGGFGGGQGGFGGGQGGFGGGQGGFGGGQGGFGGGQGGFGGGQGGFGGGMGAGRGR
jgi:hypothetical protein